MSNKITEIQERSQDINDKWNILWAQNDRAWLLKRVDELQAKVYALEREREAGDSMAGRIRLSEDKRMLEILTGAGG